MRRPVVVTGVGVVSPIAIGTEPFWEALLAGRVGTAEVTRFDTSPYATSKAAEVLEDLPEPAEAGRESGQARTTRYALAATRLAVADAHPDDTFDPTRVGVCFGMVVGNRPLLEPLVRAGSIDPTAPEPWIDPTVVSRLPAAEHGFTGPNLTIPTACAAGNSAISYASELIATGRCDAMVAGGSDEVSEAMFMMFNSFHGLAHDVVAPFDRNRDGMMLGEGAGVLFLEAADCADRRHAGVYGRVRGYAQYCDAHHMTAPHPGGRGAIRSMTAALEMAGVNPADVDYISAHGTATVANDLVEARAIRTVLGDATDQVPVSSVKGMLGHMQGAASAVEAIVCLLAIRDGLVPANVNLREQDPECAIRLVTSGPARPGRVDIAVNNAFGFGGNVSCLVLGAP